MTSCLCFIATLQSETTSNAKQHDAKQQMAHVKMLKYFKAQIIKFTIKSYQNMSPSH